MRTVVDTSTRRHVDTSALAAIILGEPDAERHLDAMLHAAADLSTSAVSRVEVAIVVEARQGPAAAEDLRVLLDRLTVETVPVDAEQTTLAVAAWRRFGKGRNPAGLNVGDCFSYALARSLEAPLLFKGADFEQTDIRSVL